MPEPLDSTISLRTDLHFSRIPIQKVSKIDLPSWIYGTNYLVFQASWAALTFMLAVSFVKGGKGGLDSSDMLAIL